MGMKPRVMPGPPRGILIPIRDYALGFPEATEHYPWGERVAKVRGKVFVFFGHGDGENGVRLSVKLPQSAAGVLAMPFATPTGYGLGKAGWVSINGDDIPLELIQEWIDESYRAVAPKALVARLPSGYSVG